MYLITGAKGQLGLELARRLPDALLADRLVLDITDAEAVNAYVRSRDVEAIINCAAYTSVDNAEDNESMAFKINGDGPRNLARTGAKLIHISTDYVFDGRGHRPYTTEDQTNPVSAYGRSKLAGEQAVLKYAETAVVIRTAWLYSAYGSNFLKTMLRMGMDRDRVNVVADQIGTPTYAGDLADAIVSILPHIKDGQKEIYHFSDEGVASWYDFAFEIMALSGASCRAYPIPTSAYPTRATRPFYSVLDKTKIKNDFGIDIPHWKESLQTCLKQF